MKLKTRNKKSITGYSGAGFTLIETAVAVMAFAIGILALFALFSSGLDAADKTRDDTRAALFADGVFNSLQAVSDRVSVNAESNEWQMFWTDFKTGRTNLLVPAYVAWRTAGVMRVRCTGLYTNVYTNFAFHANHPTNVVNHALRYRLNVELTNSLASVPWTNRVNVTLSVYSGRYSDLTEPMMFYCQFSDRGGPM